MVIDSDVPRADNSEVALVRRCSRVATQDAARCCPTASMSSAVVVASASVSSASSRSSRTASAVTWRSAVRLASALLEAPLDARLGVQVVIRDERAEVVGGQRDQHGVDELAWSAGAVEGSPASAGDICLAHRSAIRAAWAARKSLNCRVTPLKSRRTRRQSRERDILGGGDLDRELHRGAAAPAVARPEHRAEHGERDHLQIDEHRDRARMRDRDAAVREQRDQDALRGGRAH